MKKTLLEILYADVIFIVLLMLSSLFESLVSTAVYCAAFILPILLLYLFWRKGERSFFSISLLPNKKSFKEGIVFSPIFVALVFFLAALTSIFFFIFGKETPQRELEDNLFYAIFLHALVPAAFEELLFRYMPIRALGAHSLKLTVIYSSLLFAFLHFDIVALPYAFVSGIILCSLDIITGSIFTSMLLHFVNNLISIAWQVSDKGKAFMIAFFSTLGVLLMASIVYIILKRKSYKEKLFLIFADKSKLKIPLSLAVFLLIIFILSVWQFITY